MVLRSSGCPFLSLRPSRLARPAPLAARLAPRGLFHAPRRALGTSEVGPHVDSFAHGLLCHALDQGRVDDFLGYWAEDAVWVLGAPIVGRPAIRAAVAGCANLFKASRHHDLKSFASTDGTRLCVQGQVEYTRLDDSKVVVPFCDVFAFAGDKRIQMCTTYIDLKPLTES